MKSVRVRLALGLCGASCSGGVHADSTVAALGGQLLTVAVSLGVVVAAIFGCAWLVRRFGGATRMTGQRVRTLATASVGTRERVVLLEVNGMQLLIGVAPGSVRALHHFSAQEAGSFASTFDAQVRAAHEQIRPNTP